MERTAGNEHHPYAVGFVERGNRGGRLEMNSHPYAVGIVQHSQRMPSKLGEYCHKVKAKYAIVDYLHIYNPLWHTCIDVTFSQTQSAFEKPSKSFTYSVIAPSEAEWTSLTY